jgi:hypothetical protein
MVSATAQATYLLGPTRSWKCTTGIVKSWKCTTGIVNNKELDSTGVVFLTRAHQSEARANELGIALTINKSKAACAQLKLFSFDVRVCLSKLNQAGGTYLKDNIRMKQPFLSSF